MTTPHKQTEQQSMSRTERLEITIDQAKRLIESSASTGLDLSPGCEVCKSALQVITYLEQKLNEWSNKELLGETERCQFEAMKVNLAAVERERDELLLAWNGSLQDTWEVTGKRCENRTQQSAAIRQLHSLAQDLAEAIQRAFTLSAMRSEPYIPPNIRTLIEETLDKALSRAKDHGLIP